MADSSQLQNLTLNPSENAFSVPQHLRRPLRSRTYHAFVGIISLCRSSLTQAQTQAGSDTELPPVSEKNGSITRNEVNAAEVSPPNSKEFEETLVQESSIANKENIGSANVGFDGKHAAVQKFDKVNLVTESGEEVAPANKMSVGDFSVVENQTDDCAVQTAEQENVYSVLDIQMDEFGTLGELEVDKDFSIHELSEVLDSCFGMDMVIESSKTGEDSQEDGVSLEKNIPCQAEHELQQKEMELEKLIHDSGLVESSCRPNDDEEIEEGEISGEAGVADVSLDALSEDAVSLGERTIENVHASEDAFDQEEFICNDEDRKRRKHEISDPSLLHILHSDRNSMKVESRTTTGQMQDCHSENVSKGSHMETQRSGPIEPFTENLNPSARILPENAAESKISATTEQDGEDRKKKRKGPLTKERRAKKKKKDRIKRAEKNRKLGVKRLKLQPVLKPKTITYCRHYIQGRCHEGEKCKFSHDTVPLTKSKPCGHFARHSCMKGDDCPFDHELSKYPCKNYTSNGFCARGSACLFSHEMATKQSSSTAPDVSRPELMSVRHTMPDKGGSFTISKVSKPEVKFPSPLNNVNSSKQTDNIAMFREKVDARFSPAMQSPSKSAELPAAKPVPRTAGKTPKGVSFLLNGGMSLCDTSNHKQGGSSMKTSDCVDVGHETILKVPGSINKLNEMPERATPKKPWGINFLSFAQPSLSDSGGNGEILKVNRQMNVIASNLQDLNGKVNGTPLTRPQHINVLFDKTHPDDSVFKERTNFHFNEGDIASSSVKEWQSSPSKLQGSIKNPFLSFGGSWDPSTGGQNVSIPSSLKTSLLSNTPSSVQKAVQSTLAFAAKFEPDIKIGSSLRHTGS